VSTHVFRRSTAQIRMPRDVHRSSNLQRAHRQTDKGRSGDVWPWQHSSSDPDDLKTRVRLSPPGSCRKVLDYVGAEIAARRAFEGGPPVRLQRFRLPVNKRTRHWGFDIDHAARPQRLRVARKNSSGSVTFRSGQSP